MGEGYILRQALSEITSGRRDHVIQEKPMRFTLLLFVLHKILKWASKHRPAYRNYIGSIHQVKIMIKTADGKRGRLFIMIFTW